MMNETICFKCGIKLEIRQTKHNINKLYEVGRVDTIHDFLACIDTRKAQREHINLLSEQEQTIQDTSLDIGYKIIKNNTSQSLIFEEPKICAERSFLNKTKNYPDYNKLKIQYHFCLSCNIETEHQPIKQVKNVIKCLVCNDFKLNIQKERISILCNICRQYKKLNGSCHC